MVMGVSWGAWIIVGYADHVATIRMREMFCEEHADQIFATIQLIRETRGKASEPKTP